MAGHRKTGRSSQPPNLYVGRFAEYSVERKPFAIGAYGATFRGKVSRIRSGAIGIKIGDPIVAKLPRRRDGIPQKKIDALEAKLLGESQKSQRLVRKRPLLCVAPVLDVGFRPSPNPNELFVVERLVKGESLTEQMESHPRAYANATAFFQRARQLACSLRQLHQHMIVHGDIWPDNIMVEKEGSGRTRAVLIDLGEST